MKTSLKFRITHPVFAAAIASLLAGSLNAQIILEPGDFPDTFAGGQTLPLVEGASIARGTLGASEHDVDFFRFSANAGDWLVIDADRFNADPNLDSVLSLFDPAGTLVGFDDDTDGNGTGTGFGPLIGPFRATAGGSYGVALSVSANFPSALAAAAGSSLVWSGNEIVGAALGDSSFDGNGSVVLTGDYDVVVGRFTPLAPVLEGQGDFGDASAAAHDLGILAPGTVQQVDGLIFTSQDLDFFKVALRAGQTLLVDTDTLTPQLDTNVSIFDAAGRLVAFNDDNDGNAPLNGLGSTIGPFVVPADGEYFIAVAGSFNLPTTLDTNSLIDLSISGGLTPDTLADDSYIFSNGAGGEYSLLVFTQAVPEPSSVMTLGLGAIALGTYARRRHHSVHRKP